MATKYSTYSTRRKAIEQQVRRLERRGYTVPKKYHLPTVKELKALPASEQKTYLRRASHIKTSGVRKASYKEHLKYTKAGKPVYHKTRYEQAHKEERSQASVKGWTARRTRKRGAEVSETKSKSEVEHQFTEEERVRRFDLAEEYKRNYGDYPAWYKQDIEAGEAIGQYDEAKKAGPTSTPVEPNDDAFEKYAMDFIDSAPLDEKMTAEAYIQEVREGHDVGSYEEYKANLGEEPTAKETFDMKLENLDQVSPATADYLRTFYNQIVSQVGHDEMNRRFANADSIPDFDTPYETKTSGHSVGFGGVAKMMSIIKGRPLSGAESRALGRAMLKDEDL